MSGTTLCGDIDCEADVEKGKARFAEGEFEAAFENFKCGDTVEAAMGAALSKALMTISSNETSAVFARAGLGPMEITDIVGPGSILYQLGRYWKGSGALTLTAGDDSTVFNFDRAYSESESGLHLLARSMDTKVKNDFFFDTYDDGYDLNTGDYIDINLTCGDNDLAEFTVREELDAGLWIRSEDIDLECDINSSWADNCKPGSGRISVVEIGEPGEPVVLRFETVPVVCTDYNSDGNGYVASLTGEVQSLVSEDFNFENYHEIFQDGDSFFDGLPEDTAVGDIIDDLAPLTDDFALAGCYAAEANNKHKGPVFTLPESFNGLRKVPISTSDAEFLSASFYMAAAELAVVSSYESSLRIKPANDMSNSELVEELNSSLPKLKTDHRFEDARTYLEGALTQLTKALEHMDTDGILVGNDFTEAAREKFYKWSTSALSSLENGATTIPGSDPAVEINIKAFFDNPPDPSAIEIDPFVLETDDWEDEEIVLVESYVKALLGDVISDFDYDMEDNALFNGSEDWFEDMIDGLEPRICYLFGC